MYEASYGPRPPRSNADEAEAETGRGAGVPYNVNAGDSSSYNYSSGRLDHRTYFKLLRVERSYWEQAALRPIFRNWWAEARKASGYLPQPARERLPQHGWRWDGDEHVDPTKEADATVTRVQLINPHSWIHVNVRKPDGTVESWAIEAGSPNILMRRGITKDTIPVGTKIVVDGYQSKDGSKRANGRDLTLPDGTKLFLGATGTGAPYEVQRPGVDTEVK